MQLKLTYNTGFMNPKIIPKILLQMNLDWKFLLWFLTSNSLPLTFPCCHLDNVWNLIEINWLLLLSKSNSIHKSNLYSTCTSWPLFLIPHRLTCYSLNLISNLGCFCDDCIMCSPMPALYWSGTKNLTKTAVPSCHLYISKHPTDSTALK